METVFPKVVFTLFGIIPVRDTVISTWIMIALTLGVVVTLRRLMPAALEMFIGFVSDTVSDMLGRPAEPFLPFLGAVILFLLLANNLGLLPFLVTPTKDINTPLAMALVVFFGVHYYGIREKGLWGYLKGLATPIFLLPLEIIGQLSRTISLTLRLFGNVLSSEFIVTVIFSLVQPIAPLPMMVLGTVSGVLQAYIFTVLALSYIASALGGGKS
ncbi:MAG TPA: F0F1 ATP synthase subunit A [Anaerolineae bacterium]|nr:F0F1 ATP synthase subunit A [Anaerolineae bacterium]HQK14045.1 F0F1 ATP synthase subunit A [Anaerolineae bacterium]